MDRVGLGRALGFGARQAAKTLMKVADAAAAPDPAAKRRPLQRVSVPTITAAKAAVAPKQVRAAGKAVWQPLARYTSVLWLEVTGAFFGIFAMVLGTAAWKQRGTVHGGDARTFWVYVAVTAIFLYFAVSSFVRAATARAAVKANTGGRVVNRHLRVQAKGRTMRTIRFWVCLLAMMGAAAMAKAQAPVIVTGGGAPGPGRVTRSAQRPQGVNAPVPAALTTGRKIFLSNGGADAGLFPHPFTGTQDRAYGYLYNELKRGRGLSLWGRRLKPI